ncbi:hypothetical protein CSC81_18320, partial [Tenacibaculum discolor]
ISLIGWPEIPAPWSGRRCPSGKVKAAPCKLKVSRPPVDCPLLSPFLQIERDTFAAFPSPSYWN